MQPKANERIVLSNFRLIIGTLMLIIFIVAPASQAALPDYIFFSINGDTTGATMTQGDELGWGSNCDMGATINWEIWFDVNSNSTIEPNIDFLLTSENITDGNLLNEDYPIPDGWSISWSFYLNGEPGGYIFKATDIETNVTVQGIVTMQAMISPANQFTGRISMPGITPPNSLLANRFIIAESDDEDAGLLLGLTDNMGDYSLTVGGVGTGIDFYIEPTNIPGYVTPDWLTATASGIVANNDFTYTAAVDSIYGFVKDETGAVISYETDVSANEEWPGDKERDGVTKNGRFAIYFDATDGGLWQLESSSVNSPNFLSPQSYSFDLDLQSSIEQDIILTRTDSEIFVRVTENGGLPSSNYRVDAFSSLLGGWGEGVTGTGASNIAGIGVSNLDNAGWDVSLNQYDDELPIPPGLITENGAFESNVSPGDTVTFNLVTGHQVSGTLTLDPGDDPVFWDDLYVFAGSWGARIGSGGSYALYTDTGNYTMSVYTDSDLGFATDPAYLNFTVIGSPLNGLDFTVNRTHCLVTGAIQNVPLPLNSPFYNVVAYTGTSGTDGYWVTTNIDPNTGIYNLELPDGEWTIQAPDFDALLAPSATLLTISEIPDTLRFLDFDYGSSEACCGQYTSGQTGNTNCDIDGKRNLADITRLIDRVFLTKVDLCCEANGDINTDTKLNLADITTLIDHIFLTKVETDACM